MAIKKSDLYSSLWASCDELRGGMDASQYKDYVLVLLFVKYVSDKYAGQKDAAAKLAEKIQKGGSGVWGPVPMPANTQVNEAEAKQLAAWVLSLK